MKTKADVQIELVNKFVDHLNAQEKEYKKGYRDRFNKAGAILLSGGVERLEANHYRVRSGTDSSIVYEVNGACSCPDANGKSKYPAPDGRCKHRLAVYLWKMVQTELEELKKLRIPDHHHRFTCDAHRDLHILCYQRVCPDPTDISCPTCGVQLDPLSTVLEEAEQLPDPEPDDGWETFVGGAAAYDEQPPTSMVVTAVPDCTDIPGEPDEQTAAVVEHAEQIANHEKPLEYNREQYEPAPALEKDELVPFLPEAAVSMCLTIKLPENHTITYTMRGHHDNEVLERLPGVLGTLERVLKSDVDHDSNFFQRLAHAFFPRARGAYGK